MADPGQDDAAWRIVAAADRDDARPPPEGVIAAIDFPATGRPDAGFADLVRRMGTGHTVWETLPPPVGTAAGLTGADYVRRWAAALRDAPPITAVFGYCASSVFALAIAGVLRDAGQVPRTVLFDPTRITPHTVLEYGFDPALAPFREVLGDQRTDAALQAGRAATASGGSLADVARELTTVYRDAGESAFAELGLEPERADELVGWFRAYLDYLVAAGGVRLPADLGKLTVLRSADLPEAMTLDAEEFRFPVDHTDLLDCPDVAAAVTDLLA